jgi:hypothetical protein
MNNPKQRVMEQLMACAILRASSKTEDDRLVLPTALDELFMTEAELETESASPMRMMLN